VLFKLDCMSKYLIIGGVAGGATTAARLRRLDEFAEIIMFERGEYISYANCGLPYYIGDVISERDNLLVQTPESFKKRLNIDVRVQNEVITINKEAKNVEVKNLQTGELYIESYDKLIVSPGAEPIKPPIEGISNSKIFTLRNVRDTDKIKSYCNTRKPKKAVVVGAGFIGLEMAENLHLLGMQVTIVEMGDQVMNPLDFEMAAQVHQHLKTKKIELFLNDGVKSFKDDNSELKINLQSGRVLNADIVILSIGVKPEVKLIREAEIALADNGGIKVNEYLQTDDENIYALGDAMAFPNPITGKYNNTYLAGPANKQARLLADNLVKGHKRKYTGAYATAIAKVFDITVATSGMAAKFLDKEGIEYMSNIIHASSHAGYYPGAMATSLKLIFSPKDGRLYGAQLVGFEGVDKRIDIISTVLKNKGTIYDLQEIEHAYAPPYSSAKDPVNQAGFAAENILDASVKIIHWDELMAQKTNDLFLLDVRTPDEHELGGIANSINIELDVLRNNLDKLPKNKKIIVYCGVGLRGYFASRILLQNGFSDVYNLSGGYKTYECATCKQSNEDIFDSISIGKKNTENKKSINVIKIKKMIRVDACGLQCPGPILKLKQEMDKLNPGERLEQKVTDMGFIKDVESWAKMTGNTLVSVDSEKGIITAILEKNEKKKIEESTQILSKNKTMVVFSDDLDKALASMIIANGAAASGSKTTMFFTFWGLNVIKKQNKPKLKRDFMSIMFGKMMAKSAGHLKLSKMNMMGMGTCLPDVYGFNGSRRKRFN